MHSSSVHSMLMCYAPVPYVSMYVYIYMYVLVHTYVLHVGMLLHNYC